MANYKAYEKLRDATKIGGKPINDARVSRDTGVSLSTICDWRAGRYSPKVDKLTALAKYFNVPVTEFLEDK